MYLIESTLLIDCMIMPLVELSCDIFLMLFDLLDPLDILSIGQVSCNKNTCSTAPNIMPLKTCKTLREWTSIRSVWVKALRRVIETNFLFNPVLNDYDETVPLERLQHAATAPRRMLALFDFNQRKPEKERRLIPFNTTVIPFLDLHDTTTFEPHRLLFVPGGRFVVVGSFSLSRLTVVDLERYFDKKSKGEEHPLLRDYTVSVDCRRQSGLVRANVSLDRTTLLIITSERHDDWYGFPFISLIHTYQLSEISSSIGQTNFCSGNMTPHPTSFTMRRRPPCHFDLHRGLSSTICSRICLFS